MQIKSVVYTSDWSTPPGWATFFFLAINISLKDVAAPQLLSLSVAATFATITFTLKIFAEPRLSSLFHCRQLFGDILKCCQCGKVIRKYFVSFSCTGWRNFSLAT